MFYYRDFWKASIEFYRSFIECQVIKNLLIERFEILLFFGKLGIVCVFVRRLAQVQFRYLGKSQVSLQNYGRILQDGMVDWKEQVDVCDIGILGRSQGVGFFFCFFLEW